MTESRIVLFSISSCPHCAKAKGILQSKDWNFVEINLTDYPDKRKDMVLAAHQITVPQIFFNGSHLGGASNLADLESNGKLDG